MIKNANITKDKININKSVESLKKLKSLIPDYGTKPIEDEHVKVGFGIEERSNYKILAAYEHEFKEEQNKMKIELDRIEATTDEKVKETLITNLYKRYMPSAAAATIPTAGKFKRNLIEDNVEAIHNKVQGTQLFKEVFTETNINDLKKKSLSELETQVKDNQADEHQKILEQYNNFSTKADVYDSYLKNSPPDDDHKEIKNFNGLAQFSSRMKDLQDLISSANLLEEIQTLKELGDTQGIKLVHENGDKLSNEELKSEILDKEGVKIFGIEDNLIDSYKTVDIKEIKNFMNIQLTNQKQKTEEIVNKLERELTTLPTLNDDDYVTKDVTGKIEWVTGLSEENKNKWTATKKAELDLDSIIQNEKRYIETMIDAFEELHPRQDDVTI